MRYRSSETRHVPFPSCASGTMTFGGKGSLYEIMGKLQQKEVTGDRRPRAGGGGELHRHRDVYSTACRRFLLGQA